MAAEIHDPVDAQELIHVSDVLDPLAHAEALRAGIVDLRFLLRFYVCRNCGHEGYFGTHRATALGKTRIYLHRKLRTEVDV